MTWWQTRVSARSLRCFAIRSLGTALVWPETKYFKPKELSKDAKQISRNKKRSLKINSETLSGDRRSRTDDPLLAKQML